MTGTRMGNWRLEAELGRGPGGAVFRARSLDPKPGEADVAAVKVLDAALGRDPAFLERFPGEMLALRRLTHPNLARFYDAGVQAGLAWYASELAPGQDLAAILKAHPKTAAEPGLNWTTSVFRIAVQAARALKHAHHRSILHRDLKPSNLMLASDGTLKVTDFGVAKVLNIPPLALPAEAMGSACYLAPEHFTGKPVTRRSDLYALGGVLYTLLCGRPPFVAVSAAEYMHKHCYMLPDRPVQFVPSLPNEVDELICALLAKDPARRPSSAAALLEDFERLRTRLERKGERILLPPETVDPTGLHAPLDESAVKQQSDVFETPNRNRMLRGGVLIALTVLVVGLILFAFFRPRPSAESLWEQAAPLIASDNPDDWDRARDEFDKIERWHPGALQNEIATARQRIHDRREIHRAARTGQNVTPTSEAERLYRRGLAFAQNGDFAAATATWNALLKAGFADRRWDALATIGIADLARLDAAGSKILPDARAQVLEILERVKKLREDGNAAAANDIVAALEALYRDRPEILSLLK